MIPGLLLSNFTSNRPGSILKSSAHRTRGLPVGRFASSQSFVTFHKVTSWAMFALSRSLVRVAAQQTSRTRTLHKGVQSTPSFRVHEEEVGGVKQRFNYRSEIVDSWKLDRSHRNVWVSFAFIIIIGFTAFIYVKGTVIEGRKEEMMERDRMRREMKLSGAGRKKISIVAD
ncbi:hypothetical protein QR680_019117 [Steinernema hermaphroditum]|uniref:Transmembrane protein n=1 Tax=Steinernema hermaphroditum TaxID=289476 RepID=A0AA39LRV3_9BILA|nr:hypothetical protein QR680_019117 [Steinernema hermaphroditum]